MQLDYLGREGIDESTVTRHNQSQESNDKVDLEKHFKTNGFFDQAHLKLSQDVVNEYRFTFIPRKAFLKAVKALKQKQEQQYRHFIYIFFVSPQEQSILDQITELSTVLTQYTNQCMKIIPENKNKLEVETSKVKEYNKLIQISFDNAINELILKCTNEINKKFYQTQFKQYLDNKSKNDTNNNNNNNILNSIKNTKSNVNKLLYATAVDTFISQFVEKISSDSFCIEKKIKVHRHVQLKEKQSGNDNDETKETAMNNMVRKSKETAQELTIFKINKIDLNFNFHHDYGNKGSKILGIENNGKSKISTIFEFGGKDSSSEYGKDMKCDCNSWCHCFSTISNDGIYAIKIKINNIYNVGYGSTIIGDNTDSNNYIGWSVCTKKHDKHLPQGLFCGWGNNGRRTNIFRKNNFIYQSRNGNYKIELPGLRKGDIIILSYNSDLYQLSFGKENDNGKIKFIYKKFTKKYDILLVCWT